MRRTNVDWLQGVRLDPPLKHATARKYENMFASIVDDSQLERTIACGAGDLLPWLCGSR